MLVKDGDPVEADAAAGTYDTIEDTFETQEEDVEPMKVMPTPYVPTQSEIDDHCIDHLPYRTWCRECVEGFGREDGHSCTEKEHLIPIVSMDYVFLSRRGIFERSGWRPQEGEVWLKVLVVRDSKSRCVFAHAIPSKGIDEGRFVVDSVVADCSWLGYARVLLKADNEPAIAKVIVEALKGLRIQGRDASDESAVPYDPQTNGGAAAAVRLVKGSMKTLWTGVERRLGVKVQVRHPVLSWLVSHAADTRSFRARGPDGMTGYHRARGRPFSTRLIEFGEQCRFKRRASEPLSHGEQGHRWSTGTFLGLRRKTGQYRLFADGSVRYARTIKRVPNNEKWCEEKVQAITVTPWKLHAPKSGDVIFKKKFEAEEEMRQVLEDILRIVKRAPITQGDLEAFGYTAGCPKCDHPVMYGYGRSTAPHSERCRTRFYDAYLSTERGRSKIARMGQRQLEWMTECQAKMERVQKLSEEHQLSQGESDDKQDVADGRVDIGPADVPADTPTNSHSKCGD